MTNLDQIKAQSLNKPVIIVGIPAFNAERTIARVVLESQKFADLVIVCDDGSTDLTGPIAERLGAVVVTHNCNRGKGLALKSIFNECKNFRPDFVVTIDADCQHNPNEIPQLIKPLIDGKSDMVLGSRYLDQSCNIPQYRRFGLSIINWLNRRATKLQIQDTQNGFRAYSFNALKSIAQFESNGYSVESEQLLLAQKAGLRIHEVPVSLEYNNLEKTSNKSPMVHGFGLISYLLKIIFEEHPLIFLGFPGLIFLLISALFGVWLLNIYVTEFYISTNIALASIGFSILGFFCLFTSITLYSLSRLLQKVNNGQ